MLAGGLYFYSNWKMKQEVQDVTQGSLLFRKVSGFLVAREGKHITQLIG